MIKSMMLCAVLLVAPAGGAVAAEDSPAEMAKKLNQLERQLRAVQRRVFKGGALPAVGTDGLDSQDAGMRQSLASLSTKIDQIEREMRSLTGRLEEVEYAQRQMQQNLDIIQKDFALQLADLKNAAGSGALSQAADENSPALATPEGETAVPGEAGDKTTAAATAPVIELPEGDAASQYQYAFSFVRKDDMASAREALELFLKTEPEQKLALNARFWLGRVYLRTDQVARAAEQFLAVFETNAAHAKAAESLVELAGSMLKLGSKEDACGVLEEFDRSYPDIQGRLKRRANAESLKANCK